MPFPCRPLWNERSPERRILRICRISEQLRRKRGSPRKIPHLLKRRWLRI
jgi:hypothetical protein